MDKEERAKYDCVKDKEHLEKHQSGKALFYLTEKGRKDLYSIISLIAIEFLVITLVISAFASYINQQNEKNNELLVKQVDSYIKSDFKNMSCMQKIIFLNTYQNDPSIYSHKEMKDWLQGNFDSTCSSFTEKK